MKKREKQTPSPVEGLTLPGAKTKPRASGVPKVKDPAVRRLSMLVTVVERSRANYYLDLLEGFEVNFQTVIYGEGTAGSRLEYVGLSERDKAVILSVIREDMVGAACEMLEERFARVKNGRGIAFAVPFKSVMGVHSYCFLSNTKSEKRGG
ncbi:MAG: hypothetical protein IJV96_02855 [Clostridia bacterium]|nr:hypothetical protein [Clostridia bacterium]